MPKLNKSIKAKMDIPDAEHAMISTNKKVPRARRGPKILANIFKTSI